MKPDELAIRTRTDAFMQLALLLGYDDVDFNLARHQFDVAVFGSMSKTYLVGDWELAITCRRHQDGRTIVVDLVDPDAALELALHQLMDD